MRLKRISRSSILTVTVGFAPLLLYYSYRNFNLLTLALLSPLLAFASLHGLGLLLIRFLPQSETNLFPRTVALGMAIYVILGGALATCNSFGSSAQLRILSLGLHIGAIHSLWRASSPTQLGKPSHWSALCYFTLFGLGCLFYFIAGAGSYYEWPIDTNGNSLTALKMLRDTGTFAPTVAYSHSSQFAGTHILGALFPLLPPRGTLGLDYSVGVTLTLLTLATRGYAKRPAIYRFWTLVLVAIVPALPVSENVPTYFWIPIFLIIHTYEIWDQYRPGDEYALAIVCAALVAIRFEFVVIPVALGASLATRSKKALVAFTLVTIALLVPYSAEAIHQYHVSSQLSLKFPMHVRRNALLLLLALPVGALLSTLYPAKKRTWPWIMGFGVAMTLSRLCGNHDTIAYAWCFLFSAILLCPAGTQSGLQSPFPLVLIFIAMVLYLRGRDADGKPRLAMHRRFSSWVHTAASLKSMPDTPPRSKVHELLQFLPSKDRVALWVNQPELIDYRTCNCIDIRSPRFSKKFRVFQLVSDFKIRNAKRDIANLRAATLAEYLVVESDFALEQRKEEAALIEWVCSYAQGDFRPIQCQDELQTMIEIMPRIAKIDGLQLLRLEPVERLPSR